MKVAKAKDMLSQDCKNLFCLLIKNPDAKNIYVINAEKFLLLQ